MITQRCLPLCNPLHHQYRAKRVYNSMDDDSLLIRLSILSSGYGYYGDLRTRKAISCLLKLESNSARLA